MFRGLEAIASGEKVRRIGPVGTGLVLGENRVQLATRLVEQRGSAFLLLFRARLRNLSGGLSELRSLFGRAELASSHCGIFQSRIMSTRGAQRREEPEPEDPVEPADASEAESFAAAAASRPVSVRE